MWRQQQRQQQQQQQQQHHQHQPISFLPLLFLVLLSLVHALPQGPPPGAAAAEIKEDTGQVTINDSPSNAPTNLSITATIFSGVPGPKACRGSVMLSIDLPLPTNDSSSSSSSSTAAQCYNMPAPAGCGNFVANKQDGCEARLFAEPNCRLYMNTAVFIPEDRAVGGLWRSMSLRCGVPAPDPAALGSPPLGELMKNAKKRPKGG